MKAATIISAPTNKAIVIAFFLELFINISIGIPLFQLVILENYGMKGSTIASNGR
jgi:hypothetical protein